MVTERGDSIRREIQAPPLAESGEVKTVIDERFALEDIVKAHRYVEARRKSGNIVLSLGTRLSALQRAFSDKLQLLA